MGKLQNGPWESTHHYNEKFEDPKFVRKLTRYKVTDAILEDTKLRNIKVDDVPAYLRPLFNFPIFSPSGEWHMFMKMNYFKHKADKLRQKIVDNPTNQRLTNEYNHVLKLAYETRAHISDHNLRLVASFARKQSRDKISVEEWFSNGTVSLLRAIDQFDCNRANPSAPETFIKFSTYASWAIKRNYCRDYNDSNDPKKNILCSDYDVYTVNAAEKIDDDPFRENAAKLFSLIEKLDHRARWILLHRFGVECQEMTLKEIGKVLHISTEAVRQLQAKAIRSLRKLAGVEAAELKKIKAPRQKFRRSKCST